MDRTERQIKEAFIDGHMSANDRNGLQEVTRRAMAVMAWTQENVTNESPVSGQDLARGLNTTKSVTVTVSRSDLIAVLRKVPGWVPEGAYGDGDWSHESLDAKAHLLAALGMTTAELWEGSHD